MSFHQEVQTIGADLEVTSGNKANEVTVKIKYAADGNPEFIASPLEGTNNLDLFLAKINVADDPNIQLAVVDKNLKVNSPEPDNK